MDYWTAPRERPWQGSTVFIVGSSASLRRHDLSALSSEFTIALAASPFVAADAVYFDDPAWMARNPDAVEQRKGMKFALIPPHKAPEGVNPIQNAWDGISVATGQLCGNRSAVGGAINLAVILGAVRIVLVGIGRRDLPPAGRRVLFTRVMPRLRAMRVELLNSGIGGTVRGIPTIDDCDKDETSLKTIREVQRVTDSNA